MLFYSHNKIINIILYISYHRYLLIHSLNLTK